MDGADVAIVDNAGGDRGITEDIPFITKDEKSQEDDRALLSKEDLLRIESEEPVWRRLRIALITLFWVVWFGLIIASALFIVFSPRCPYRPKQEFWQSKVGYWVDPYSFKDSNGDLVGDLKGLTESVSYIDEKVGAGFIILGSIYPLFPNIISQTISNFSFETIHSSLGSMDDFQTVVRAFKKRGLETVITLNFNSVPIHHDMAISTYLTKASQDDQFSRVGPDSSEIGRDGEKYYSTYGSGSHLVDLNLLNVDVMEKLKNVTRFWLSKGVDGILLADAAFYVKEGQCKGADWASAFPTCKLFTPGTIAVIQELRKVVDEVSVAASRHKVLIADPGNTGFPDDEIKYAKSLLGNETVPGAHLIITRFFTQNRDDPRHIVSTANDTLSGRFALITASPNDKPHFTVSSTASMFLLPGTPIIYAATELGWAPTCNETMLETFGAMYPFGEAPLVGHIESYLPMPWDSLGSGFSNSSEVATRFQNYINTCSIHETIETSVAAGRGYTIFNFTTSLVKLRKENPALLWGTLTNVVNKTQELSTIVYRRQAEGFDDVIVALVKANKPPEVLDLSHECSEVTPILVHPPSELLLVGEKLSSSKVYIAKATMESLFILKCAA